MLVPSMPLAAARTSSRLLQNFTPPALPRPPAWICALTIHCEPPRCLAASTAASGELATLPGGTAMPYFANNSLAWYSWKFMDTSRVRENMAAATGCGARGGQGNDGGTSAAGCRAPPPACRHDENRAIRPTIFAEAAPDGKG